MSQRDWEEVRNAFNRVLESGPDQEGSCSPTVQREVKELLHHLDHADEFLALDARTEERHYGHFQPSDLIANRYRVLARLGSGGMGDVYEVEDLDLKEIVALKVLRFQPLAGEKIEQLRRELRHARRIVHRNICRQFDIGYYAEGETRCPFLTMERVEGEMLTAYVRGRGGLAPRDALALAEQLCAGLQAAHRAKIVHADLKPQNLIVERGTGRLVILDFGLSRHLSYEAGASTGQSQMLAGTPAYLAPERYEGSPASYASDIFSVGILLHELIADAQPPVTRDIQGKRQIAANLPTSWRRTITACLSLNPAERPESPELVLRMLCASGGRELRRKTQYGVAIAITVAFLMGLLTWLHGHASVTSWTDPRRSVHEDAPGAKDLFHTGEVYLSRQTLPSVEWAIVSYRRGLAKDPGDATANAQLARALERKYELTRKAEWLDQAADPLRKAEQVAPHAVETLLSRSVLERSRGNLLEAISNLRDATKQNIANGEAWKQLARTLNQAGDVLGAQAAFEEGLANNHSYWGLYQECGLFYSSHGQLARAESQFLAAREMAPDQPIVLASLGGLYVAEGRLDEAEKTLSDASILEPSASIASNLGSLQLRQGHYSRAIKQFRTGVSMTPDDYRIWNNLGIALQDDRQPTEAKQAFEHATSLLQDSLRLTPDDPDLLSELAIYAARSGDRKQAGKYESEALIRRPQDAGIYLQAAVAEAILGNQDEAVRYIERSLELGEPARQVTLTGDFVVLKGKVSYDDLLRRWNLESHPPTANAR